MQLHTTFCREGCHIPLYQILKQQTFAVSLQLKQEREQVTQDHRTHCSTNC